MLASENTPPDSSRSKIRSSLLALGNLFRARTRHSVPSETAAELCDVGSTGKPFTRSNSSSMRSSDDTSLSDDVSSVDEQDGRGRKDYTNSNFVFGTQCSLDVIKPPVVITFPSSKYSYLGDATDIRHIGEGKCVVVDMVNNRTVLINKHGKSTTTYQSEKMLQPWAVDISKDGVICITSRKNKCIATYFQNGEINAIVRNDKFMSPSGIAISKSNRFFVSDTTSNLVTVHEMDGTFIASMGDTVANKFNRPRYITMTPNDDVIVCDSGNHSLKIFDTNGNFVRKIGSLGRGEGQLKCPYGVCTDIYGNILVADHYNDRISYFSKTGQFIRHLVTSEDGLFYPQGISITPNFKLFVTHGSLKARRVIVFDLRSNQIEPVSKENIVYV